MSSIVLVTTDMIGYYSSRLRSIGVPFEIASEEWLSELITSNEVDKCTTSESSFEDIESMVTNSNETSFDDKIPSKSNSNETNSEEVIINTNIMGNNSSKSNSDKIYSKTNSSDKIYSKTNSSESNSNEVIVNTTPVVEECKVKTTIGSRELGERGELKVLQFLQSIFPKLDIRLISNEPHVGDIHLIDDERKLLFMIEVKNKVWLSKEDIGKFRRDLNNMKKTHDEYNIVGLFISILSPIPSMGKVHIEYDCCFLGGEDMITPQSISLIVEIYSRMWMKETTSTTKVVYEIPPNVYSLISQLTIQSVNSERELAILDVQLKSLNEMRDNLLELQHIARIRNQFIELLRKEFPTTDLPDITHDEEERLREWLQTQPKRITKKEILREFPQLHNKLSLMTLASIKDMYC